MRWHGNIDMQGAMRILNLPQPTDSGDAVPKSYITDADININGTWNFSNGNLILPQGLAVPTGLYNEGSLFWDTDDNVLYIFDGAQWSPLNVVTLDQAYDAHGSGNGRIIEVDSGAVKLDSTANNYAPLELTNRTTSPTLDLQSGQLAVINNKLYIYDGNRGKWLTPSKLLTFGDKTCDGSYLRIGVAKAANTGWRAPYDGTITAVTARAACGNSNKKIIIRVNNNNPKIFFLNNYQYLSTNDNIDFNAGDIIRVRAASAGSAVYDLIVSLEICWRK